MKTWTMTCEHCPTSVTRDVRDDAVQAGRDHIAKEHPDDDEWGFRVKGVLSRAAAIEPGQSRPYGSGAIRRNSSGRFNARRRNSEGRLISIGSFDTREEAEAALDSYGTAPFLELGELVPVVRVELDDNGNVTYGLRDGRGTMWRMRLEPWPPNFE